MRLIVVAECSLQGKSDLSDEEFDDQSDAVMEELLRLDALDPSVGGSITRREFEVEVYVEASSLDEAFSAGASQIRSALHAAGVDTANWPCGEPTYWVGLGQHPDKKLLPT